MSERKKPTIKVSKIQICVAAILLVLVLVILLLSRYIEYRCGLSGEGPGGSVFLELCFLFPLIFTLIILSSVSGIIHNFRYPRSIRKGIVAVILVLIPIMITYISLNFFSTPTVEYYLNGFSKWVVANVDLDELEKWRTKVPEEYWGASYRYDFPKVIPSFAIVFKPKFIRFSEYISGPNAQGIEFGWGGGMSEWGFVITEPSDETSKPGEISVIHIHEGYVETRRTIRPGIYVYVVG